MSSMLILPRKEIISGVFSFPDLDGHRFEVGSPKLSLLIATNYSLMNYETLLEGHKTSESITIWTVTL